MPPIRSVSAAKPVKTERTHEENQERAYIAASRRSDRSLEARVESARRASEIHKRRTGRSLRVTEQDVVNEEMYEEEDDDLPLQYRRLTAHLNSGDPHFNRRLAAYLTNHVAMRTALDQAISSSYAQQYPNGQPWSQPYNAMQQQQPWMMNQMPNQQPMQQFPTPMMMPPQMIHRSPASFRQSPYPMPAQQQQQRQQHSPSRPMSNGSQEAQSFVPIMANQQSPLASTPEKCRTSVPHSGASSPHLVRKNTSTTSLPSLASSNVESAMSKSSSVPPSADQENAKLNASFPNASQSYSPSQQMNIGPFATTLPPETQMFFGPGFDQSGMFAAPAMMNSEKPQQPFYSYNPNAFNKTSRNFHPSYDGMSQTLAPGALDNIGEPFNWPTPPSATTDGANTPFTPAFSYPLDPTFNDMSQKSNYGMSSPHGQGSGYVSPVEAEWTTFIDPNSWADTAA